jgi:hypothetical protein
MSLPLDLWLEETRRGRNAAGLPLSSAMCAAARPGFNSPGAAVLLIANCGCGLRDKPPEDAARPAIR